MEERGTAAAALSNLLPFELLSPSPPLPYARTEKLDELFKREIEGGARSRQREEGRARAAQKRRGNFSNLEARRFIRQCRIFLLRRFESGERRREGKRKGDKRFWESPIASREEEGLPTTMNRPSGQRSGQRK